MTKLYLEEEIEIDNKKYYWTQTTTYGDSYEIIYTLTK
tara:strand:- start:1004 stop:1117 length:114 start_codon:yes stop_codon:yes gene_type:complete